VPVHPPTPASRPVASAASQPLAGRVNQAIDRGLAFLRKHAAGLRPPQRYEGLLGLTLLECGVPATDPAVVRIAQSLRVQAEMMNQTYELSTAIFFFDRLGKRQDDGLIRTLADRLVAGQQGEGTWSYGCPLADHTSTVPFGQPPRRPGGMGKPVRVASGIGDHSNTQFATLALWIARRHGVSLEVREALRRVEQYFRAVQAEDGCWGYRSTAIRPGQPFPLPSSPVERARRELEVPGGQPYRPIGAGRWAVDLRRSWSGLDEGNNGWLPSKSPLGLPAIPLRNQDPERQLPFPDPLPKKPLKNVSPPPVWRTSNTCAGLLALAVGHGIDYGRDPGLRTRPLNDPAVAAAVKFLGKAISSGVPVQPRPGGLLLEGRGDAYTLWSVERVGTLYGLQRIGQREWYPWAAEWLVGVQHPDGSWQRGFGPVVDTCFALLVLRRSNLAPDLTYALRGTPKGPSTAPPRPLKEGLRDSPVARRGQPENSPPPKAANPGTRPPEAGLLPIPPGLESAPKARDPQPRQ
jgi:hypothetical protein